MKLVASKLDWLKLSGKSLVLPLFSDTPLGADHPSLQEHLTEMLGRFKELNDFQAKEGQTAVLYPESGEITRLILLGMDKATALTDTRLRRVAGKVVNKLRDLKQTEAYLAIPDVKAADFEEEEFVRTFTEGVVGANYEFGKYKTEKEEQKPLLETFTFLSSEDPDGDLSETLAAEKTVGTICREVRDMVNDNANVVTPQFLADYAMEIARTLPVNTSILGREELRKAGCNLLLAVASGNEVPAYLLILEYQGNPESKDRTAIVGKGITFDTGGLDIKPPSSMLTMKCDMAGAAATLGTLKALASLKLPVNVIGVVPACENAVGANAYKPGDVFTASNGTTVEITHTDAEGRLVLADALAYVVKEYKPTEIIDLATLTGAVLGALGYEAAGVMGNNQALVNRLIEAGDETGEKLWQLPLWDEYKEYMKSDIADIRNDHGVRDAGSIVGGIFLQKFVGETPWAHLDIAGTAFMDKGRGFYGKGATGFGVRLLVEYFTEE